MTAEAGKIKTMQAAENQLAKTLTYKILEKHLLSGILEKTNDIGIKIDQTLTQDATGTTAFLLFESMGMDRVKNDVAVSYVDHNMSQFGPENHNDHRYLQTVAAKVGAYHSRPGNGICHQVHLERFAKPGDTLLGSDSHTPTCGGIAMLAVGAGGMDVAVAMGGGAFYITAPKVIGVKLTGKLQQAVASKDIILKLLSILTTKGNVGCVVEYFGEGAKSLTVPQRATVTNMGAELGVTTSVFASDEQTEKFLKAQNRAEDFKPLAADENCKYDRVIQIDLSTLEPMAAISPSPDNVKTIKELEGTKVSQVAIGSCTNASYADLMMVAETLKGKTVATNVELAITPGSKQVMTMMAENGAMANIIAAGARILEAGCGACIGQGFSPAEGTVSVRTFNRNFAGRSGTTGDVVMLTSPETAVAAAIKGEIIDPRKININNAAEQPEKFLVNDNMIQNPLSKKQAEKITVLRSSTIVVPESPKKLTQTIKGNVVIKCGDKITTDHIMPAGAFLKYRSNVPEYAKYVFNCFNKENEESFAQKTLTLKANRRAGIIVAAESYGQGSSREHAALCPMYLGIRAVIAKSIERIHKANLINFCVVPIEFTEKNDYNNLNVDDELEIIDIAEAVENRDTVVIKNKTTQKEFTGLLNFSDRDRKILLAGGLGKYTCL